MTVTISTTQSSGGLITVNWALAAQNQTAQSLVKVIYTDTLFGTAGTNDIISVSVPSTKQDASGNLVNTTSYTLSTLTIGYTYHILVQIDGISSASTTVKAINIPAKPEFIAIARDRSFAVKFTNLTLNSISDGFSTLNKLDILVAGPSGLKVYTYDNTGNQLYNDTIQVPQTPDLSNNDVYEVVCTLYNAIGSSLHSSTSNVIPKNTPDPLTVNNIKSIGSLSWASANALDTASINGGIQVLANWPSDRSDLIDQKIPITKAKVIGKYKKIDG